MTNVREYTASKLRGLRAEKDMSVEEVASKINIHKDTIRRYENQTTQITLDKLEELLDFYGADFNTFFRDYNKKHNIEE